MSQKKTFLTKYERFEVFLYTMLGIRIFRKMVFLLERVIHLRDKKVNANYHVGRFTPSAVEEFKKYLFYNGSIHVRNLVYALIYGALRIIFGKESVFLDYIVILLAIKDIYCVMLQRYNFLQIKSFRISQEKKKQDHLAKQLEGLQQQFSKTYPFSCKDTDLRILYKLKEQLSAHEPVVIDDEMAATLLRLEAATKRNNTNLN